MVGHEAIRPYDYATIPPSNPDTRCSRLHERTSPDADSHAVSHGAARLELQLSLTSPSLDGNHSPI